ncbi:hypothetical protein NDU88_012015 [Pleurodeles waltl]|uniref:Uncharacterized protein n=1 Tax=Pleurodeles waltl TaxID=8319 RepID=A0AAV7QYY9_PLEWA|nr:hypothetical protein NDU88_012015 [Pleurodeles waltl]
MTSAPQLVPRKGGGAGIKDPAGCRALLRRPRQPQTGPHEPLDSGAAHDHHTLLSARHCRSDGVAQHLSAADTVLRCRHAAEPSLIGRRAPVPPKVLHTKKRGPGPSAPHPHPVPQP